MGFYSGYTTLDGFPVVPKNHDEPIQATIRILFEEGGRLVWSNRDLIQSWDMNQKKKDLINQMWDWVASLGFFIGPTNTGFFSSKFNRQELKTESKVILFAHGCTPLVRIIAGWKLVSRSLFGMHQQQSEFQDVKRTIFLVGNLFSQHVFRLTALRVCLMIYSYNYTYRQYPKR